MTDQERAFLALGNSLKDRGYHFITPTPETLRRVNARSPNGLAHSLTDIFGWSRRFAPEILPPNMLQQLIAADAVEQVEEFWCSRIRFSTLNGKLYLHSAYPTVGAETVFFGPDTYRFCRLIAEAVQQRPRKLQAQVIDIGCGTGAGGLTASGLLSWPSDRLVLTDINPRCLSFARVNAAFQGVTAELVESDVFAAVAGEFDLILANPPYLIDPLQRLYRDGGGALGAELALRILAESLDRLATGGVLVLYTGSAIVGGEDGFLAQAKVLLGQKQFTWDYAEIDPDVFSEELETPAYRNTDRIAAVGLVVER